MKACTFMFMVVNDHHGGNLSTFFVNFSKISILGCLATILTLFRAGGGFSELPWYIFISRAKAVISDKSSFIHFSYIFVRTPNL